MADQLMTLADVANLACVERAVVTMWRRRTVARGRAVPFPAAAQRTASGQDLFRAADVVEYLAETGRGNNPEFRDDSTAHATLPRLELATVSDLDAAAAVLCLRAAVDEPLAHLTVNELLDQADEIDPDDTHLFREIEAVGEALPALATFVDQLVDAAFDTVGALLRLESLRGRTPQVARVALARPLVDLIGEIGSALALESGEDAVAVVDPTGASGELAASVVTALGERIDATVVVPVPGESARWTLRAHSIRGWAVGATLSSRDAALAVAHFPNLENPALSPLEMLTAIEDLQLDLTEHQPAVIVGPASALCDSLRNDAVEDLRDVFLRGRLRLALRLPRGLMPASPREQLGLWVLGPTQHRIDVRSRWFAAGDLSGVELTDEIASDIVSDAVATVSQGTAKRRAFRTVRLLRTADVIAERGMVVPAGARGGSVGSADPAATVLTLHHDIAGLDAGGPSTGLDSLDVEVGEGRGPGPHSVGGLLDQGNIRILRGTKVDGSRLRTDGAVPVFTADDVLVRQATPRLGLGAMELSTDYPKAARTRPGDVVFCASPRPAAVVDRLGLAVVAAPARVMRVHADSGLVPDAVANAINAMSAGATDWRAWDVPVAPVEAVAGLADALAIVERERYGLEARLARLQGVAVDMAKAVSNGHVRVQTRPLSKSRNVTKSVTFRNIESAEVS